MYVEYLAVVVAAVLAVILGTVWFGPLFGKMWMASMGITPEKAAEMRASSKKGDMAWRYGVQAIGALLMAFVFDFIFVHAAPAVGSSVKAGLLMAFLAWIGFVAPVTVGSVLWDNKTWKYWFVTAGYYLVLLLIFGLLFALWP
jgi:hypothetical protein